MSNPVNFHVFSNSSLTNTDQEIIIDFFGYSSGVLVGITLFPQCIRVYKTKSTNDLSWIFLVISLFASVFKLIYGIMIDQLPIVVTAPIILCETIVIMIAKCMYDKPVQIEQKEIELTDIKK